MNRYKVLVTRVIDGDTFYGNLIAEDLDIALPNRKFRLLGIDTPERNREGYQEATEYTRKMILGRSVEVTLHGYGGFGRILAVVYVNGMCLNDSLLAENLAEVYKG
jgi:endonuclease YncB( thermonuclease family)